MTARVCSKGGLGGKLISSLADAFNPESDEVFAMVFSDPVFFLFLAVVLLLYYRLNLRGQNWLLLVASYFFYAYWDWRFLSLMVISTVVDYTAARIIDTTEDQRKRRFFLGISMVVNLTFLGFFKYFNFFIDSAERLLSAVGLDFATPTLYIILPAGISFYTFESMSYVIDVYRREVKPIDRFAEFALFIAYFPKLVAGPIMRIAQLMPEIQSPRRVTANHIVTGCLLILIGLVRKAVIADGIGRQVDAIFAAPGNFSSPELLMGIYLFALQIYCDFAGYSDIARGTSRLLGIELVENFQQPYFSANIAEFWRRWHISLSSWLRDYLYIPLGGNRQGTFNTYRNLMITMLLGGLWHGAAWTFVIWGGLHGLYLVVHRLWTQRSTGVTTSDAPTLWDWRRLAGMALTFHCVLLAWVFFRAPGLRAALDYLTQILAFQQLETWRAVLPQVLIPWLLLLAIDIPQFQARDQTVVLRWPKLTRDLAVGTMLFVVLMAFGTHAPFIYFQF
jgi:alginate O-acetyltransferase complex protein AlgI